MENLNSIVGHNLSALRKAKKLTQQEVALALNYSDKSVSKWELGYALPSIDILKELADFYGVSVDFLITEGSDAKAEEVVTAKKSAKPQSYKVAVTALIGTFVWLAMAAIYVSSVWKGSPISTTMPSFWPAFVWAVPASVFAVMLPIRFFWGKTVALPILWSIFSLTLLLAFCIHFQWYLQPGETIWYILILDIPLQAIIILIHQMSKK